MRAAHSYLERGVLSIRYHDDRISALRHIIPRVEKIVQRTYDRIDIGDALHGFAYGVLGACSRTRRGARGIANTRARTH